MLILPTYTDPWGLVVNEAMACGRTVVLSRVAGCAADLVRENWNGLLVPREMYRCSHRPCKVLPVNRTSVQPWVLIVFNALIPIHRRNGPPEWNEWSNQREVRVTERIPKSVLIAGVILGSLVLTYLAYSRPRYFTGQTYSVGLLF